MISDYFVLNIHGLESALEDWVSRLVFSFGALGVSENLPFSQPEGEEQVFTQLPSHRSLDIYFAQAPQPELLATLRAQCPQAQIRVRGEQNRDWLSEWKKGFKPFPLVGGHWVVPSWCEAPPLAQACIWIDPGMAFGTGTHETTQLVAEFLAEVATQAPRDSCLDVGTGTGILAILAHQLGFKNIRATELEIDSRRVALENFVGNKARGIILDEQQIEDFQDTFDVVMANIIDGVLVRVQQTLKARVKAGGWLVVSGIIAEREKDFVANFHLPPGVNWLRRVQKGDWLLFATKI